MRIYSRIMHSIASSEKISRRTGISAQGGGQYQTYWFYERARARYANERAALSSAETRVFDRKYPKTQCIDKTDLAKFLNAWERVPHVVSSGAQKSFGTSPNRSLRGGTRIRTSRTKSFISVPSASLSSTRRLRDLYRSRTGTTRTGHLWWHIPLPFLVTS